MQKALAERENAELALRLTLDPRRRWGDSWASGIWLNDAAGRTIYTNPVVAEMLGYSSESLTSTAFLDLVHPDDREAVAAFIGRGHLGTGEQLEVRLLRQDRTVLWCRLAAVPTRDGDGALISIVDVTDRRLALDQLAVAEERFRSLADCASDPVTVIDLEGNILHANEAARELCAAAGLTASGSNLLDLFAEESRAEVGDGLRRALREGTARAIPALLRRPATALARWEIDVSTVRPGGGLAIGFTCVLRDVGQRRREGQRTAVMLEVAQAVGSPLELEEILARVHRRLAEVFSCDAVGTFRWDDAANRIHLVGQYAPRAELRFDLSGLDLRRGNPFVDDLADVRTVVIRDAGEQSLLPAEVVAPFVRSLAWTQLIVRDRPVGALALLWAEPGPGLDPADKRLFEGVAQELAVALETIELHEARRLEAQVASALADAGRELLSGLEDDKLLDRLCQLTASALGCDASHTLLREPEGGMWRVVASHGYTSEQQEWMRVLSMPSALVEPTAALLADDDTLSLSMADAADHPLAAAARELGVEGALCMALRGGAEVIGFQVACFRHQSPPFSPAQMRIAKGLAQLTSIALHYRIAVQALEGANRLKSDFIAAISHELRTPLNVIMGYGSLLLDRAFGELTSEQSDVLERMEKSAASLHELIETMLDLSRIETGRVQVDWRPTDLARVLSDVAQETAEQRAARPDVKFLYHLPAGGAVFRTDAMKLKIILKNLVSNAFKFTVRGAVTADVEVRAAGVEIRVTDTGCGIEADALPIIFEAFRQAPGTPRGHGGVGLGLYIVRQLVSMLRGDVWVESEVGGGTTFTIWLPVTENADPYGEGLLGRLQSQS